MRFTRRARLWSLLVVSVAAIVILTRTQWFADRLETLPPPDHAASKPQTDDDGPEARRHVDDAGPVRVSAGAAAPVCRLQLIGPGGEGIAGAKIATWDGEQSYVLPVASIAVTGATGYAEFPRTQTTSRLGAFARGFIPVELPVMAPDCTVVQLEPAAALHLRLVDLSGRPVVNQIVTVQTGGINAPLADEWWPAPSGVAPGARSSTTMGQRVSESTTTFNMLRPGQYWLSLAGSDLTIAKPRAPLSLGPGEDKRLDVLVSVIVAAVVRFAPDTPHAFRVAKRPSGAVVSGYGGSARDEVARSLVARFKGAVVFTGMASSLPLGPNIVHDIEVEDGARSFPVRFLPPADCLEVQVIDYTAPKPGESTTLTVRVVDSAGRPMNTLDGYCRAVGERARRHPIPFSSGVSVTVEPGTYSVAVAGFEKMMKAVEVKVASKEAKEVAIELPVRLTEVMFRLTYEGGQVPQGASLVLESGDWRSVFATSRPTETLAVVPCGRLKVTARVGSGPEVVVEVDTTDSAAMTEPRVIEVSLKR